MNAVNFLKIYGDNNYFTAFHRISYNNSQKNLPHFIQKFTASTSLANQCKKCDESGECGEKIIHRISPHFLQKITAKFTAFLTKNHRICFPTFTKYDLNSEEISKQYVRVGAVE